MPSSDEILAGLSAIARAWIAVAIGWHAVLGVALAAVATGRWRASNRTVAIASAAPLASVSIASALLAGNPFNAIVLAIAALALAAFGSAIVPAPIALRGEPRWPRVTGLAMLAFGWVYPHFLEGEPAWLRAIGSPIGLVPCPSIAVVLGIGLCGRGLGSRGWTLIAAGLGLFYGLFGAFRLGVWIDLALVAGAIALLFVAARIAAPPRDSASPLGPASSSVASRGAVHRAADPGVTSARAQATSVAIGRRVIPHGTSTPIRLLQSRASPCCRAQRHHRPPRATALPPSRCGRYVAGQTWRNQ